MSNPDLLLTHVNTLFVLDGSGLIRHENDPDRSRGPRLYMAGSESGNIVRVRHDIDEQTRRQIEDLAASEPALTDPDSTPVHLERYAELIGLEEPVTDDSLGLDYRFPDNFSYDHDVTLVRSETRESDRLAADLVAGPMPASLAEVGFDSVDEFWAPWCVAIYEDEIASVAITARLGTSAAEVGVTTVRALRGRGFAAAAASGWAAHPSLRGRTLFYGTSRSNVSSQRVAARLGLIFIGASLRLS